MIALSYMAVFAAVDGYTYPLASPTDQGLFQRIALNILRKGAFSGSLAGKAVFCPVRPPLYPFILALTWKITGSTSLIPIRLIQSVCYLLTLYFIYRIAVMLTCGNGKYGLLSALFAAVVPFSAAAAHVILTESLALFFLTISVFFAVRFRVRSGRACLVALGTGMGLLILQRPSFMLIPALFLVYVLLPPRIKKRDIVTSFLLVMLPLTAVIAPWTLYARSETGSWALVRAGVGFNLMTGILENKPSLFSQVLPYFQDDISKRADLGRKTGQPLHSGDITLVDGSRFSPDAADLTGFCIATYVSSWSTRPSPTGMVIRCDQFLKEAAFTWAENNPLGILRVVTDHVRTLLFGKFQPLAYHKVGPYLYLCTSVLKWGLYILFVAGTVPLFKQRKFQILFFPVAIIFYIIIVHSPMHTEPRYFIYAYTFMALSVPALFPGGASGDK